MKKQLGGPWSALIDQVVAIDQALIEHGSSVLCTALCSRWGLGTWGLFILRLGTGTIRG